MFRDVPLQEVKRMPDAWGNTKTNWPPKFYESQLPVRPDDGAPARTITNRDFPNTQPVMPLPNGANPNRAPAAPPPMIDLPGAGSNGPLAPDGMTPRSFNMGTRSSYDRSSESSNPVFREMNDQQNAAYNRAMGLLGNLPHGNPGDAAMRRSILDAAQNLLGFSGVGVGAHGQQSRSERMAESSGMEVGAGAYPYPKDPNEGRWQFIPLPDGSIFQGDRNAPMSNLSNQKSSVPARRVPSINLPGVQSSSQRLPTFNDLQSADGNYPGGGGLVYKAPPPSLSPLDESRIRANNALSEQHLRSAYEKEHGLNPNIGTYDNWDDGRLAKQRKNDEEQNAVKMLMQNNPGLSESKAREAIKYKKGY